MGFPDSSDGNESAHSMGDLGLIPGSARSRRERNGNPLQYSCLENPMDRGDRWITVHAFTNSQTRLSNSDLIDQVHFHLHMLSLPNQCSLQFAYAVVSIPPVWLGNNSRCPQKLHNDYSSEPLTGLGIGIWHLFCLHDCLKISVLSEEWF